MTSSPLVTVVVLCYNQARFVAEALHSVKAQTHPAVQLIIVDDASTDDSAGVITEWQQVHAPEAVFLRLEQNVGNCRAFNRALALAQGEYVVDLAADDVLLPHRLASGVARLTPTGDEVGVLFSNCQHVDEQGQPLRVHFPIDVGGRSRETVPSGDVYAQVLRRYFIPTPTLLIKKQVLQELGGYDETLAYEDFDFFVRSARRWQYLYQDEITVQKRRVPGSLASRFYQQRQNALLASTLSVCEKALALNKNETENRALAHNVRYHLRQSFYTGNFGLVASCAKLLRHMHKLDGFSWVIAQAARLHIRVWPLYRIYRACISRILK